MAQDAPLYKNFSAADMLHLTRNLNRSFDDSYAKQRLDGLGIPLKKKSGKLSGGQQAQLALTLALARHPRLLILDEPLAALDPLARQDFMATVMTSMTDDGVSVMPSSHAIAELERMADYLIVLGDGELRLEGETDELLAGHRLLTGPAAEADRLAGRLSPVQDKRAGAQAHLLVGTAGPCMGPRDGAAWLGGAPGQPGGSHPRLPAPGRSAVVSQRPVRPRLGRNWSEVIR